MDEKALYIVMRADLQMPRGKEIAQAIHAFYGMDGEAYNSFEKSVAVICVRADDEDAFNAIATEAFAYNSERVALVKDAARTVLSAPAITCACIGPFKRSTVTESLPKLAAAKCY